ncbi:unnamed protein product [Cunninghamella blakesleeana]
MIVYQRISRYVPPARLNSYLGKSQHIQRYYNTSIFSSVKSFLSPKLKTPQPRKVKDIQIHHGKERNDSFSWMENIKDPHLSTYIQAENEYSRKFMRQHRFLHRVITQELKQKLYTPNALPPLKTVSHGYEYYTTSSKFGNIYLRKPLGQGRHAEEEVLLNTGILQSLKVSIRKVLLSPDHTVFSYNTEREGMEYGDLHFKDLKGRKDWKDEILTDVFNFVWANDQTVFYTIANAQLRPYKVYAHKIGTDQSSDILIYEEKDDTAFVDITCTKDSKYITINSSSLSSSEIRVIDASFIPNEDEKTSPLLTLIEPRQQGLEYYVDHHNDSFYILTNADGFTNFKLVKANDGAIEKVNWKDAITMKPTEKIEDVDIFQNHIVIYGRSDGLPMILCHDLKQEKTHQIKLPEDYCVVTPGSNLEFNTNTFRFSITSPFTHESTYEYNMDEQKLNPLRVQPVRRFQKEKYTCTQIHVTSHDNKSIPVTLIHQKNVQYNGRNPLLLRSYGAYGVTTDPEFRIEHFPLLERGWVIALAHVRGGSELGRDWYEEGKLYKKMNSFRDFISVGEYLVNNKITSPKHMAAIGTSAGGLLVGGMINMRPDLFKALILRVPFVDPLSSMLDQDLPLTQVEYPEWGNPSIDIKAYNCIKEYSPYDNIGKNNYNIEKLPSVFATAGMKDQRVIYWQPLKFIARLRDTYGHIEKSKSPTFLLKVNLDYGHFGGNQTEQEERLSETAELVCFLITQIQS